MSSVGRLAFKLAFELSPIILTNGLAENIPGGALPIVSFTEALNFVKGLLTGGDLESLDDFFAHFRPLAGAALIDNQIGKYPFANQRVAANAVIAQPLRVSMLMTCPAKGKVGYATKLATMMALKAALDQHNNNGGTYVVVTPTYFYTDCVMTGMRDVSNTESKQPQINWQLDFEQPLLTEQQAQQAQNSLMKRLSAGSKVTASSAGSISWSGLPPTVGDPASLASPSLIPAGSNLVGTNTAAPDSSLSTIGAP